MANITQAAVTFEAKYGVAELLKASLAALIRALIKKGILDSVDIEKAFQIETNAWHERHQQLKNINDKPRKRFKGL